ncbi:MAG: hypothetical protein J7L25_07890 [Deltaproteobacteria bacterium]|nr:hypothetical protein [Candidatus Tharpella aukensis]
MTQENENSLDNCQYSDFSLPMYEQLCKTILQKPVAIRTIHQYLTEKQEDTPTCILRHDVDRQPLTALNMATLEHSLGIKASYYFRFIKGVYIPDIIKAIHAMGHEIGYHYETLSKCRGNHEKAIALFQEELTTFRSLCPIATISMHGRPFSPHDNRNLWQKKDFREFGLAGECYLSIDYRKVTYLSDTGRTWNPHRYNIRDQVKQDVDLQPNLESTNDLISFLDRGHYRDTCILTHPNRWASSKGAWLYSASSDFIINQGKRVILALRRP